MSNVAPEFIAGYTGAISVRPGQRVGVHVSGSAGGYAASIVRLDRDDPAASGWSAAADLGRYVAQRRDVGRGSCVHVPGSGVSLLAESWTIAVWAAPSIPRLGRNQGVIALGRATGGDRVAIGIGPDGRVFCELTCGGRPPIRLRSSRAMEAGSWERLVASYADETLTLRLLPVSAWQHAATSSVGVPGAASLTVCSAVLGATHYEPPGADGPLRVHDPFNGKLSDPVVLRRAVGAREAPLLDPYVRPDASVAAAWLLGPTLREGVRVPDAGPAALDGTAVNGPLGGVTGPHWSGGEIDFQRAPHEYRALQFHEDDLDDARWPADFHVAVPAACTSGAYGVRLVSASAEDTIPLIVTPEAPTARTLVVLPVLTYLAYANHRWRETEGMSALRHSSLDSPHDAHCDRLLAAHPEFGHSLYDRHLDGSPACHVSRLRPLVTMRADYEFFLTGRPRHLAADVRFLRWLDRNGHRVDVASDEDVHAHPSLLAAYDCVVTGSHPEYVSAAILDGMEAYLRQGGRLVYLGGNGFYWVTGVDEHRPHLIEVRREHGGSTPIGDSPPGEGRLSTTGEPGGLWRHRGRAPQRLTGVGATAAGWGRGAAYTWAVGARAPQVAELVDGIDLGRDFGYLGPERRGAANDEIDRADTRFGTPTGTIVLASSAGGHDHHYQGGVEDQTLAVAADEERVDLIRSDVVYISAPNGAAVFSAGSIDWTAALSDDETIARLTANVLNAFVRPVPAAQPADSSPITSASAST